MVALTEQEKDVVERFKQLPPERWRYVMLAMFEADPDGWLLEQKFRSLADQWESETRHVASPRKIASHPLVRQLIAMGRPAIPLILRRMKSRPWFWFHALKELSGEKVGPITPEFAVICRR